DLLAGEQRQGIDQGEADDALAHQFGDPAHHHAARTRAGQHDIVQVFVEQELRDLLGLRLGRDAGPHRTLALAAAVEARRIDAMPRAAQPVRHLLPDPAALIGAVHQYVSRHCSVSLRINSTLHTQIVIPGRGDAASRNPYSRGPCSWIPGLARWAIPE